ncbi:hypothetical protein M4D51_07975 [Microbacterium sp. p3-SID338]|uniref:hypothetical protein n=1 Tax=Microbacterium sp. p3-SID338 TaxID=2916214 RepID=UPI0021A443E5|nr:hypothetical protein [Microbacterium sp. p3-SID338]MCT1395663.1 hypothetical protein [Microbacterium sp. p3-SID338]
METWMVTLLVAGIAGVASVSVAWLNVRGESAELKQLKAINEALAGMPTAAPETERLRDSRDVLAVRVAGWIDNAPTRRRLVLYIVGAVVSLAVTVVGLALSGLDFTASDGPANTIVSLVTTVVAGVVMFAVWGSVRRVNAAASRK